MQQCKRVCAALAALVFSAGAFAQAAPPDSVASNLFVGLGYGQAKWRPGCPGTEPNCDDTNPAFHVFAGYQFTRVLAAEIAFTNYGKAGGPTVEVKGRGWEASAIARWPVFGSVSVLGRLGAYRGVLKGGGPFANKTESNYGFTYGFGAQLDLTQNLGLRGEWQTFPGLGGSTITDNDLKVVSVSALWRFK